MLRFLFNRLCGIVLRAALVRQAVVAEEARDQLRRPRRRRPRFIRRWPTGFLTLLLVVPGCSPRSGTGDGFTRTVDTLDGGAVVVRHEGRVDVTGRVLWRAEEDLRIGRRGGGGPEQFGEVTAIDVDGAGNIFVADQQASEVRVFRPDGRFSHAIGGRGGGPGEFERILRLALDTAGNLWVRDGGLMRYSAFGPDGRLLAVHAIPVPLPDGQARVDGASLVTWGYQAAWPGRDGRWKPITGSPVRGLRLHHPLRISFEPPTIDSFPPVRDVREIIDGYPRLVKPYSRRMLIHLDHRDGIWFAETTTYRIIRRTLAGDTTLIVTMPSRPERVTQGEKETAAREWIAPRRIPLDQVGDEKPVLETLTTDEDGRLYVFVHMDGILPGTAVDVFEPSGSFLARVRIPASTGLVPRTHTPVIRRGHLYGIARDELDVPHVVRLKILDNGGRPMSPGS